DLRLPPPHQRLAGHEHVGHAAALVLVVLLGRRRGPHRQWLPDVADELLAALVHAHHRPGRVVRAGGDVEHVLQGCYEGRAGFGRDAPLLLEPRLEVVFFRQRHTVVGSMASTTSSSTSLSASSCIVQRACPSGGGEQVRATSRASWAPSSLRYCRSFARFLCRVASNPSATNWARTRATVMRLMSRASAMRSSGQASGPAVSALSRMRARRVACAGWVPVRTNCSRAARWSSVSRTSTLLAGLIRILLVGPEDSYDQHSSAAMNY